MPARIFVQHHGTTQELPRQPYVTEELLQRLIADTPALIGAELGQERRWLLITQEMGVPDREGGSSRWAIDHLFIDQDGVPTLVETKRSSDTRIRREVVGQMLDYAANGIVYWPIEEIRGRFERRCQEQGLEPETELRAHIGGGELAPEAFWQQVKTNLQAGRVRLLFVADEIPAELERIIEFLNVQMDPAEVLGVELAQYAAGELRTLVPRLIGRTATAEARKQAGVRRPGWAVEDVRSEADGRGQPWAGLVHRLLDWAPGQGLTVKGGNGATPSLLFSSTDPAVQGALFTLTLGGDLPRLNLQVEVFRRSGVGEGQLGPAVAAIAALADASLGPVAGLKYPGLDLPLDLAGPAQWPALGQALAAYSQLRPQPAP